MSIQHWPSQERPRERLVAQGAEALSDAELLAIMLGSGSRGKTALDVARDLLVHYQGLRGVFQAKFENFNSFPGMGVARYSQLQAALELSRRFLQASIKREFTIKNSRDAQDFLIASLRHFEQEVFAGLFLDNRHRMIHFERMFHGTINAASVYPREVVKRALHYNAAAMIIAHNHPSGIAEPSMADQDLTRTLHQALALVDVRLLDHMVVGEAQIISFAERGWL